MVKSSGKWRFLLVAGAMAGCLGACGGSGSSSPASAVSAATAAASWTNVSVRALDGKVNISWDRASGSGIGAAVATYNIYCSTNPSAIMQGANRIASDYQGQSFDHSNVTNGQRYYYLVTEVTAAGEGPASRVVSATPQAALPAAPYGLKGTALDASAKLELIGPTPPNPAAVSYNLYRSTSPNSFPAGNLIASQKPAGAFTPYSDPNLVNGTTYYYALTAVVAGRESGFSPVVSARPQAKVAAVDSSATRLAAFAAPAGLSAEPGNGSCVVSWTEVAPLVLSGLDPAGSTTPDYILYWSDSADVLGNVKGQIDSPAKDPTSGGYRLGGLNNGTMYYLQLVAAVKGSDGKAIPGRFTAGPVVSVTPGSKVPAVPNGVSAGQGPQQVLLTWNKDASGVPGVTYRIYFSTTDGTPAELVSRGTSKTGDNSSKAYFTHSGLEGGKTYYYVVTSVGESESPPSNVVSVTL